MNLVHKFGENKTNMIKTHIYSMKIIIFDANYSFLAMPAISSGKKNLLIRKNIGWNHGELDYQARTT